MFTPAALGILYLLAVAWPLARIDIREHRLPNRLVLPAFAATLIGQLVTLLLGESPQRILRALAVAFLVFTLGLLCNRYAGLGMGDVKLLAAMALALGWFNASVLMALILVACASALLVSFRAGLKRAIALGPHLFVGFGASVFALLQ
jgi:leader peptidase (prepilin peptidase)/N-methyltransferase